jgi:hypothetical protein
MNVKTNAPAHAKTAVVRTVHGKHRHHARRHHVHRHSLRVHRSRLSHPAHHKAHSGSHSAVPMVPSGPRLANLGVGGLALTAALALAVWKVLPR